MPSTSGSSSTRSTGSQTASGSETPSGSQTSTGTQKSPGLYGESTSDGEPNQDQSGGNNQEPAPDFSDSPIPSETADNNEPTEIDFSEESQSASSQQSASDGSGASQPTLTAEEEQARLEELLNASIGSYDGMIQREQDYIHDRARQRQQAKAEDVISGTPYDDPNLSDTESGQPVDTGDGSAPATANPPATTNNETIAERSGSRENTQGQRSPPPADIPDGSDDDVVARQIREAAEQETDPVLREKLWEEYRQYKNSQ
ncbi:MAG: hypothetical protein Aseana_08100 [Candidatus Pelagadaptatus aseana]|uniref:hypothetical protein n=1 Tax=Candidatus Pelagadaptatus aseana TaxID=3120508 RepID=UPI0039B1B573